MTTGKTGVTRWIVLGAMVMGLGAPAHAADSWSDILEKAKGQTVQFNAWGGGDAINAYIEWAGREAEMRFGVKVEHVKIADAGDAVMQIESEFKAGKTTTGGSVDLVWVNGENFKTLKQDGLLFGPWANLLPNFQFVDLMKPVRVDFAEPTDGFESPWGTAQLTFIADKAVTPVPPLSASDFLLYAKANPGRMTYPKLPDFHGTTFVKQLLSELIADPEVLQKPVDPASFLSQTKPLWDYLDELHPVLWHSGTAFPASAAEMNRMLADHELNISLTFNPNEGANLVASGQLPQTAYSFGFTGGMIGNVHFVAIPVNARAKEGAMVFANFLLSAEAQDRKANINVWGDGTVLDPTHLPEQYKADLDKITPGSLEKRVPTLAEPHSSWVKAIETEWLKRYGGS